MRTTWLSRHTLGLNILIVSAAMVVLYLPVFQSLWTAWSSNPDYSHGYFILPISLFILWTKRSRISRIPLLPSAFGLPLIVLGLFAYVMVSFGRIASLNSFSFITLLMGLVLYYAGKEMLKEVWFPILFLFFMFPIPSELYISITAPMKLWISKASVTAIDALGVTVFREGNILYFANTSLEVTEACSGVRSIITFLVTGVFLSYVSKSFAARATLLLSVVPIAFLINFLRVTLTGILAQNYGPEVAQGFFHEFAGAAMFLVGLFLMLLEFEFFYVRRKLKQGRPGG